MLLPIKTNMILYPYFQSTDLTNGKKMALSQIRWLRLKEVLSSLKIDKEYPEKFLNITF